jgi:hypothetical protein
LDVVPKLNYSFKKFMRVFNKHVGYVHDYPGFVTLYTHINKRLKLLEELNAALQRPSYKQYMDPKQLTEIDAKIRGLHDRYVQLDTSLKTLDKLFADFNREIELVYNKTLQLEVFAPFRTVKKKGWFGKKYVTLDRQKALDSLKSKKILLSSSDAQRLVDIRKVSDIMHDRTVAIIRQRKDSVREKIHEIDSDELDIRKMLVRAHKVVKKAFAA